MLIKSRNQVQQRIDYTSQELDAVELLVKTRRRSSFIQNAQFNFFLYRFE